MKKLPLESYGILRGDVESLGELGNRELAELGIVDVTAAPFGADATGRGDATKAIQDAVFFARHRKLAVFFPLGEYLVSDMIECRGGWSDERYPDHRYLPYGELWPCVLIGQRREGRRPVVRLAEEAEGFGDAGNVKPVFLFDSRKWVRQKPLEPLADRIGATGMNQLLYGFEIEIGSGNPGAACVYFDQAEGSTIQDCAFRIGDGYAGVWGAPGSGGALFNLDFSGGEVGLAAIVSTRPTVTLAGGSFEGQRHCAIEYAQRGPLVAVGCAFRMAAGVPVLRTSPEKLRGRPFGANLVDCRVEYEDGVADRGSIAAIEAKSPITLRNVWIRGARWLIRDATREGRQPGVALDAHDWRRVREAAFSYGAEDFPVACSISVDGEEREWILEMSGEAGEPPSDLCRRHIRWDWQSYPSWESEGVANVRGEPYLACGDGETDDTEALQRAIDENEIVFLPKGAYRISRPLKLKANSKLIGLNPALSLLVPKEGEGSAFSSPTKPQPAIQTPDTGAADLSVGFVGVFMPRELSPGAYQLDWRCGGRASTRCFFSYTGYTELETVPLSLGIYPWTNWEWSDELLDLSRKVGVVKHFTPANVPDENNSSDWAGSGEHRDRVPNWPLIHVRGHGGGGFYPFMALFGREHGPQHRKILVEGIEGPFEVYHALLQYENGEAELEIRGSKNVHFYGTKNESFHREAWIRESEGIRIYGTSAVGVPGKERRKFTVERSRDVVLTTLFLDAKESLAEHKGPMVEWIREDRSVHEVALHDYPTWFEVR